MKKDNYRKKQKMVKIIIIFLVIIFWLFFIYLAYRFITDNENSINHGSNYLIIPFIIIILFTSFLIIFAFLQKKNYLKRLKNTRQPQRFIYLDTFYYVKTFFSGRDVDKDFYSYDVLQDKNTKKIYAISGGRINTNASFQCIDEKASIWTGTGIRGVTSNWKEIPFNSEGLLWIDEEIPNYLTFDGEKVVFDSMSGKIILKNKNEIRHCNSTYDFSLLEKATFIIGYAEFDTNI